LKKQKSKVGTPFFLAPEAWEGKAMTKKSDIWSLGVVLYELCIQKYPFIATTMEELQQKILKDKFTPIP
jgi:serine/threonine protein kinase